VLDIAHSFRLNETQFDKKSYLSHLKTYMKKVKEAMKEKGADDAAVKDFETKA
jgi:ribosomal protein S20